jgi:hypothetical protein
VDVGAGWLGVARYARVVARMLGRGAVYEQGAGLRREVLGHVDPTVPVVVDHAVVVVPEHIDWRFRAGHQSAHQSQCAAQLQELFRGPRYLRSSLCNN